ncbi:hypothetical protein EGT74_13895 [Chitinophaga lutea]|uniref:Uncharacterized protein n=1 Tax=Chitinophaga lutea TaxID=2488634 RepID=A0A3N4PIW0_9BACT|nr:DUF6624 domain-containing protein [Chitinophaga lutea]RPE08156.1 hypothetical protein EGT74_13895 [Chitinophaga lutea]
MFSQDFKAHKKQVIQELEQAFDLDQGTRKEFNDCVSASGMKHPECVRKRLAMVRQDSINQQIVSKVLDRYGWPPAGQITEKAGKAIFYVIQHAPLAFQLKYAGLVDTAFKRKAIIPLEYAFFIDRLRTKQGMAQLYGTQHEMDNLGNRYLYPVKNWYEVNTLRQQYGIPPLDLNETPEYRQYPKVFQNDTVVLIGHIYKDANTPIPDAAVVMDSVVLGKSNDSGFFIVCIPKKKDEDVFITIRPDADKPEGVRQAIRGSKEFYHIYVQFK